MGSFSRWLDYAKTKVEMAVRSGNRELDELEAEREAQTAERPWLRADGDAPTFEEARARIEWEAEQAARGAGSTASTPSTPSTAPAGATPGAGDGPGSGSTSTPPPAPGEADGSPGAPAPAVTSPEERARAAEAATARLELEARQRESAARLDAIREELGIDPPPTP